MVVVAGGGGDGEIGGGKERGKFSRHGGMGAVLAGVAVYGMEWSGMK